MRVSEVRASFFALIAGHDGASQPDGDDGWYGPEDYEAHDGSHQDL